MRAGDQQAALVFQGFQAGKVSRPGLFAQWQAIRDVFTDYGVVHECSGWRVNDPQAKADTLWPRFLTGMPVTIPQDPNPCIDLHCNSTASDGALTPQDLKRRAAEKGVTH